jgi:selenocysteine-specific elongation factor
VTTAALDALTAAARRDLARRLASELVSAGIPARDFAAALLPRSAQPLADHYLEELRRRGVLELEGGRVVPPGEKAHMTDRGAELAGAVEAAYREAGLAPPSPAELAERLAANPAAVEGVCRFLVQRGRLVRLEGKLLVHAAALEEIVRRLRANPADTVSVGEFKDQFGLTRKLAIPLLEWLDSQRVTVRQGDVRRIVRR